MTSGDLSRTQNGIVTVDTAAAIAAHRDALLARLWAKTVVDQRTGCWEWQGSENGGGYGTMSVAGRIWIVSRLSLTLKLGRTLESKIFACHACDNPPCWNPDHLFPGTAADNNLDRFKKGMPAPRRLSRRESEAAYRMYWKRKMPLVRIAHFLGCSVSAVDAGIQRVEKSFWEAEDADMRSGVRDDIRRLRGE